MSAGRHTGKLVLKPGTERITVLGERASLPVRSDASYLIAGGTGGFGLIVAEWLIEQPCEQRLPKHGDCGSVERQHRRPLPPPRPQPAVNGAQGYALFRIGDAVAGRNIHAAIYDAARLCKDL